MKRILTLIICTLPAHRIKNWLLRRVGFRIAPTASMGPCLVVNVDMVSMASGSRIGPFNVFRDLRSVEMGSTSVVGQWNWISAAAPLVTREGQGVFRLGRDSALTSRHYVDASGGVTIGRFSTVAGVRSTFITHGIDWRGGRQQTRPISIGDYCIISSNVCIPPGAAIPDRSVVGMGATVVGGHQEGMLWVDGRAAAVKPVHGAYFSRARGFVDPPAVEPDESVESDA